MTVGQSLGEIYDPFGEHLHDPFPLYERARRDEPVFFSPEIGAWVLTRYEDVREALRQTDVFSSANSLRPTRSLTPAAIAELQKGFPLRPHVVNSDGETHRRLRAPLTRALSPARVDGAEPYIRRRAGELVDAMVTGSRADLMDQYAVRLPADVISHLYGLSEQDREVASESSYGGSSLLFGGLPEDEQPDGARGYVALQHLCARYLHTRRAEPGEDLVSEVVTTLAPGTDPLSADDEARLVLMLTGVFIAGHVTTSAMLGSAVHHLLTDRSRWELVGERPELIENVVEENARFDPPSQGFLRVTTRPVTIGGADLPAGAEVMLLYASANRDEAFTDRPDTFDITRGPTRHLTFASGLHACVGAGLARREVAVTLDILTRRLPTLRLVEGEEVEMRRTMVARGPVALHVTW